MRLAFELVVNKEDLCPSPHTHTTSYQYKQALSSLQRDRRFNKRFKKLRKYKFSLFLTWDVHLLPSGIVAPSSLAASSLSGLWIQTELYHGFPGSPACR